jgi:hypothetical protein
MTACKLLSSADIGFRKRDPKQSSGRFKIRGLACATWNLIIHSGLARNRVRSPHQRLSTVSSPDLLRSF